MLLIVLAIGLGTLVPRPFPSGDTQRAEGERRRILVLSNPIHTDIALPADSDVLSAFGFVSAGGLDLDFPGVEWIVFGWGGRSFYLETRTWDDLKFGPVFAALTVDQSVMHVERAGAISEDRPSVQAIDLSPEEFRKLVAGIAATFQKSPDGMASAIEGAAYHEHDAFFPANGTFNAFLGCNIWTAARLRDAGLTTGTWTPLPVFLDWSLSLHNEGSGQADK
ncbi:TIGR02117 family protein [Roseibium sediminis]|uniref:TIGR02117 family protein n=1 Tax=Roseibium sediminis TaxID=1775174 RepID=UPI001FCB96DD|nr:TIGR02117 family protein [Roseibium sediminis]